MNQIEAFLNEWFGLKAPHLPEAARKFIVTVAPWLTILGVVVGAWGVLGLFMLSSSLLSLGGAYAVYGLAYASSSPMFWLSIAIMVVVLVLEALAIPGLMKKTYVGWRWIYYASLLSFVQGLVALNFVSAIIGGIIGWYLLFQVRSLYAGAPALHVAGPTDPQ